MTQSTEQVKRGGKRVGSGRPVGTRNVDKWIERSGIGPVAAAEVLHQMNERALWRRVLLSEDDGIVLRGLCYLTDKRDGKAPQSINITSANVTISANEIESARAIIRELIGTPPSVPRDVHEPPMLEAETAASESAESGIMANGNEGEEKGGV